MLAKTVATLDVLTGGRAFCGVGAGWWEREHAAYGLPFPPPASGSTCSRPHRDDPGAVAARAPRRTPASWVDLPETTCYPRPVGPVPVIVGGRGPRLLGIAARLGDACNLPSDRAVLEPGIERVARGLRRGRSRPG